MGDMLYLWLGLIVLFVVVEAATVGLTAVWFALGSVAGLICAACGAPLWVQLLCFVAVSAASLVLTRPLARRVLRSKRRATNADRVLEMTGVVTEAVDNVRSQGAVTVDGKVWTARSAEGKPLPAGTLVRPVRIEGVKLIVVPAEAPAETGQK